MVRWMRWHCPPDTVFEIRTLAVSGRARYLSVTEAPHNTEFHTWMGKKHFVYLKPPRPGTEPQTLAWKAAVLTTTLGPPPHYWNKSLIFKKYIFFSEHNGDGVQSILLHTWQNVLNPCICQCRYSFVIKTKQLHFSYYRVMIEYV